MYPKLLCMLWRLPKASEGSEACSVKLFCVWCKVVTHVNACHREAYIVIKEQYTLTMLQSYLCTSCHVHMTVVRVSSRNFGLWGGKKHLCMTQRQPKGAGCRKGICFLPHKVQSKIIMIIECSCVRLIQ